MNEEFISRLKQYILDKNRSSLFSVTSEEATKDAEDKLGFLIPDILKYCYLNIGNGGFGPGYGVIGLTGGYASDYGDIVETYKLLESDQKALGNDWEKGILPFCEWGCNIFSCVDCNDQKLKVYTYEDAKLWPQKYSLEDFFQLWLDGVDILSFDSEYEKKKVDIINPFTGEKSFLEGAKRKK